MEAKTIEQIRIEKFEMQNKIREAVYDFISLNPGMWPTIEISCRLETNPLNGRDRLHSVSINSTFNL